jgi:hypothetical protein
MAAPEIHPSRISIAKHEGSISTPAEKLPVGTLLLASRTNQLIYV